MPITEALEAVRVPFDTERGKLAAERKRFTPARMYRALHKRLKHEPDTQERIISAVLENACDRDSRWHGPAVELVLRGDPDLRAAMREEAQAVGIMPRIIIQGPQIAGAVGDCIDISGSAQPLEPASDNTRLRCIEPESSTSAHGASSAIAARAKDDAIDELRAQVAALTASVAQLASIIAAQRGASVGESK